MISVDNQRHLFMHLLPSPILLFMVIISPMLALNSYALEPPTTYTEDIYHESVLVLNQSEVLRLQAVNKALASVVIRASGSEQALANPQVKKALQGADEYLYQHAYQSTNETITIAGSSQSARRLLMQFSAARVQQLLRQAQLPIWPNQRTQLLLWMATDDKGKRLAVADSRPVRAFKQVALSRGLPLVNPLLDLEDRQNISAARIWAEDEASIIKASKRYPAQSILSGQVKLQGGQWQAKFILIHQQQRRVLKAAEASLALLSERIIHQATDYFVSRDAVVTSIKPAPPVLVPAPTRVDQAVSVAQPISQAATPLVTVLPKRVAPSVSTPPVLEATKAAAKGVSNVVEAAPKGDSVVAKPIAVSPIATPTRVMPSLPRVINPPLPKAPSIPSPPMGQTVGLSDAPGLKIIVDDIRNFTAYTALVNYLKALPMVDKVSVDDVRGAKLLVRLTHVDTESKLIDALQNSDKLSASTNSGEGSSDLLFFRWR